MSIVATKTDAASRTGKSSGAVVAERAFDEPLFVSVIIAAGMAAGLLVPGLANALSDLLLPSLFVIVLSSIAPFRSVLVNSLLAIEREALVVVVWLQVALPVLVLAGGRVLGAPDLVMPFVLLSACSGAVFATPTIAGLFSLDRAHAARVMIASTLAMPVSICLFVGPWIGLDNMAAFETFAWRVAAFLVLPALIMLAFNCVERKVGGIDRAATDRLAQRVGVVALSVFAISIMAGVAERFAVQPGLTFSLFCGALVVNMGMLLVTRLALGGLGADVAHTASIVAMTRNVGLGLAMTGAFFGPELATYVALCQVPLLIGPMIVRLRIS